MRLTTLRLLRAMWLLSLAAAFTSSVHGAVSPVPYRPPDILRLAEKVADYQLATLAGGQVAPGNARDTPNPKGWVQAAFFVGLLDLAERSAKTSYGAAIMARGVANEWQLGERFYHADDHSIGFIYLWASRQGAGPASIRPLKDRFESILRFPPQGDLVHADVGDPRGAQCALRWCWSDALFMAPPVWLDLARQTGDARFSDYAKKEFEATTAFLFDPSEALYFRDSRFFERRGKHGEKVFWSRGNGWAFSGLARSIPLLPSADPTRERMEQTFRAMAAKLKAIQKPDGYWAPSLLAAADSPPETSGTGFFVHGLAWGIEAGLLDRREYEPIVRKGWSALVRAVHDDGKVGYVQRVSDRPDAVSFDDTQFYGVGAFLLAASAVMDLDLAPAREGVKATPAAAQAILHVQRGGTLRDGVIRGGEFRTETAYTVPSSHFIHDGLFAFEGVGWETDLAGYRLYLDERFAVDIFGKRSPGLVLHQIGKGADDYHALAPWGMDILKVGNTVGLGSLGLLRDGRPGQLKPKKISVRILANGPLQASVEVTATGFKGDQSKVVARFDSGQGSALTRVRASAEGADDLITGLVKHPGTRVLYGSTPRNGWSYVATWGNQSLANDGLGMALFYRTNLIVSGPQESEDMIHVRFADPSAIDYAFAAAWEQDRQGVTTFPAFEGWLTARVNELAARP